jgi:hypothetical protein
LKTSVKVYKHFIYLLVSGFVLWGCERELTTEPEEEIEGYQIKGRVSDRLGIPVEGAEIYLYFYYETVDTGPEPDYTFHNSISGALNVVQVFDAEDNLVRTLMNIRLMSGTFTVQWNKLDSVSRPVPSGAYTFKHFINGGKVKSYTIVIDGTLTSVTDSTGVYVINNKNLPIGFYPVPFYNNDSTRFIDNRSVMSDVVLRIFSPPDVTPRIYRDVEVHLVRGRVSIADVILQ